MKTYNDYPFGGKFTRLREGGAGATGGGSQALVTAGSTPLVLFAGLVFLGGHFGFLADRVPTIEIGAGREKPTGSRNYQN